MGVFSLMKEAKQATMLEEEVTRRVRQLDDPTAITVDNLELQLLVMKSDLKRYSKGKFLAKDMWGNAIDWEVTIKGTEGFIDIYESAIDESLDKWLNSKFLKKKYAEIEEIGDQQDDKNSWSYYSNQLKAITGLQKRRIVSFLDRPYNGYRHKSSLYKYFA